MILHADSNSFYANCERMFRPDLWGKPVVVLSNNDGIIVALTQEAKNLGLKRGDAFFKVKPLCQAAGVAAFSSNYALYADISRRITSIYLEYAPQIEVYSIDESFLFFPDFDRKDIYEISVEIRNRVLKDVGMPICVGGGPTKTIAKWYNKHAKAHNGVYLYDPEEFAEGLKQTPVGDIWNIGLKGAAKLIARGIRTGYDLMCMDPYEAKKLLTIHGYATVMELRGKQAIDRVERLRKDVITSSRQFGQKVFERSVMDCILVEYVQNAVEKLRKQNCEAGAVTIYISTCLTFRDDGSCYTEYGNGISCSVGEKTCYTPQILAAAKKCLDYIWRDGYGYKTLMVSLSDLETAGAQGNLFVDPRIEESRRKLMENCARLAERYGRGTVFLAGSKMADGWQMKRELMSPCYTTRLDDLPVVE